MSRQRPHVLIVEDESWLRELWSIELEEDAAHFRVTAVGHGQAALAALTVGGVQAAIIDIGLPEMSGETLMSLVRGIDPRLPILAVTGFDATHYQHLWEYGIHVLQKPFRTSWLMFNLRALLAQQRPCNDMRAQFALLTSACG